MIGARLDLPHGLVNTVMLAAAALQFTEHVAARCGARPGPGESRVRAAPRQPVGLAGGNGRRTGPPRRLRDIGVPADVLPDIAAHV